MSQGSSVLQEIDQSFDQWYTDLRLMLNIRSARMSKKSQRAEKLKKDDLSVQYKTLQNAYDDYAHEAKLVKIQMTDVAGVIKNANPKVPEHADRIKKIVASFTANGNEVEKLRNAEQKQTDKSTGIIVDTADGVREKLHELELLGVELTRLNRDASQDEANLRKLKEEEDKRRAKTRIEELENWEADLLKKAQLEQQRRAEDVGTNHLPDARMGEELNRLSQKGGAYARLNEIEKMMKEHRQAVPKEEAAFLDAKRMEDILEKLGVIPGENDKRKQMLTNMKKAKDDALVRYAKMGDVLKSLVDDQNLQTRNQDPTNSDEKVVNQALRFHSGMLDHIPLDYRMQPEKFDARIANVIKALDPAEAKKMMEEANVELAKTRESDVEAFSKAIKEHGGMDYRRFDPYFNQLTTPLTSSEMMALTDVINKAIKRAHQVRDAGGTVSQVEAQLAHIPRGFWPTEFVNELQGWRKVERAMLDEAVENMAKESTPENIFKRVKEGGKMTTQLFDDAKKRFEDAVGFLPDADDTTKDENGNFKKPQWLPDDLDAAIDVFDKMGASAQAIEDIYSTLKDGKQLVLLVKWLNEPVPGDFSDWLSKKGEDVGEFLTTDLIDKAEAITGYCGKITNGMKMASTFSPAIKEALGDYFVPGISLALGIKDFAIAAAKHIKRSLEWRDTNSLQHRAERERATKEELSHYEGLENAFENHKKQMERLNKQHRHEMLVAGVQTSKGIFEVAAVGSGIGAPAAYGVKAGFMIVEKAIVYGGKIYFANIDFNAANRARKTLFEARAGNRVAQLMVFEQHAVYAKMLIAIMVMDNDPLAVEFIVNRGYKESDLQKPEVSALLLRTWMMDKAEQTNPDEGPETRLQANVEGVLGKTPSNVVKLFSAAKTKAQELYAGAKTKIKGSPYVPGWKAGDPYLTETKWSTVKDTAVKNGLFPEGTGIGKALGKLEGALQKLGVQTYTADGLKNLIANTSKDKIDQGKTPPAIRQRALVLAALNAALEAENVIAAYQPMHVPMSEDGTKIDLAGEVGFHAGMAEYLGKLRSQTATVANVLENLTQGITKTPDVTDYVNGKLEKSLITEGWIADGPQRDMNWTHAPSDVAFTVVAWTTATDKALKDAWMDKDGEGDPAVLKLRSAVTDALRDYEAAAKKSADVSKLSGQEARKLRVATHEAMQTVIKSLGNYWKDCGHNGIRDYCNKLLSEAGNIAHALDMSIYPDAPPTLEERIAKYEAAVHKLTDGNPKTGLQDRLKKLKGELDKLAPDVAEQTLDKIYEDVKKELASAKLGDDVLKSIEAPKGTFALKAVKGKPGPEHFNHVVWEKAREECVTAGFMDADPKANAVFAGLKTWGEKNSAYLELVEVASDSGGIEVHHVKYEQGDNEDKKAKKNKAAQKARFEVRKALTEVFLAAGEVSASIHTPAMSDYVIFIVKHSQKLNFQALEQQRKVTFTSKLEFSKDGWKTSYDAAIAAGAVQPHDGRAKALAKAFGKYDDKFKSIQAKLKSDDRKEARLEARRAAKLLSEVGIAVDGVARAEGYSDNSEMSKLLDFYSNQINKLNSEGDIFDLMNGAGKNFPVTPFRWDNDDWQRVKKLAINDGILDDAKSGFGKALNASEKAWSSFMVAQEGNVQPAALAKMRIRTLAALDAVEKSAQGLQGTNNANFKKYLDGFFDVLAKRREALEDKGEFPSFNFRLDNAHWQSVKKTAVNLGLMADAKTGLGALIDRVAKIYEPFDAASKSYAKKANDDDKEDMDELREPLKEAAALCKQTAGRLETAVNNADFQKYMAECAAMMDQITDYADGKQKAVLNLPPFEFDKDAWNEVRDLAVAAGIFEDKPTNLSKAIENGQAAYDEWINETDPNKEADAVKAVREAIVELKKCVGLAQGFAKHKSIELYIQRIDEIADEWTAELDELDDSSSTGTTTPPPQSMNPQDPVVAEWLPKHFTKTELITESEWKETVNEAKKHGWHVTGLPIRKSFKAADKAREAFNADKSKDKKGTKPEYKKALQNLVVELDKLEKEARFDSKWDKAKGPHPGMKQFAGRLVLKAQAELGNVT